MDLSLEDCEKERSLASRQYRKIKRWNYFKDSIYSRPFKPTGSLRKWDSQ